MKRKTKTKVPPAVMTEAIRLAKVIVKAKIKEMDMKVSWFSSKELTRAARELIHWDNTLLAEAEVNCRRLYATRSRKRKA